MMDGLRARRLKSGSPLGRVVDEALDLLQQAAYCLWLGYCFNFDHWLLEMLYISYNMIFYFKETKFRVFGKLQLVQGEIGSVEIELIVTLLILMTAYLGPESF